MNRAEIIEGLKDIHDRFYAFTDYRKTTEACLKLLESENALIDRVLEIIDEEATKMELGGYGEVHGRIYYEHIKEAVLEMKNGNKE